MAQNQFNNSNDVGQRNLGFGSAIAEDLNRDIFDFLEAGNLEEVIFNQGFDDTRQDESGTALSCPVLEWDESQEVIFYIISSPYFMCR